MSVEHQPATGRNPERAADLEAAARQRLEQLKTTPEVHHEAPEQRAEAARETIQRQTETAPPPAPEAAPPPPSSKPLLPHFDPGHNYRETVASLQRQLAPARRAFSKVIHAPAVERVSDALEHTVARPSILNGAIWGAVTVGLIFYLTARIYGFLLSGSEMLIALIAGAIIGPLVEAFARLLHRR